MGGSKELTKRQVELFGMLQMNAMGATSNDLQPGAGDVARHLNKPVQAIGTVPVTCNDQNGQI